MRTDIAAKATENQHSRWLTPHNHALRIISLAAEYLRVESPSAEVQGHSAAEHRLVPGKADVAIVNIEPVGNYAVRLSFSDGHDTGIYSWDILHRLGREQPQRWAAYLKRLQAAGLAR